MAEDCIDEGTRASGTEVGATGRVSFSPRRALYALLGSIFLGLAFLGAVMPILPTTPFVLVAASLFARSSPRVHRRLLESRLFGPTLRRWEETGGISARAKVMALLLLWGAIALSCTLAVESWPVRGVLIACAVAVSLYILNRPTVP